jgi:hypothetical protein
VSSRLRVKFAQAFDTKALAHPRRQASIARLCGLLALAALPGLLLTGTASASRREPSPRSRRQAAPSSAGEQSATPTETTSTPPGEAGERRRSGGPKPLGGEGRCHPEIELPSTLLTAGESATLSGSVSCPSSTEADEQTITVYRHVVGSPGFDAVGSTTPTESGTFSFTTEALASNSVFYAAAGSARSARIPVKVSPLVTIAGPPAATPLAAAGRHDAGSAGAADTLTFTGNVSPDEEGARVILQREGPNFNESWSKVAVGEVAANGAYSVTHRFTVPGAIDVRVVVRAQGLLPAVSEALSYEMTRRQNPQLTIKASAAPLPYGQSAVISGVAAGPADQQLRLLAGTQEGEFAQIATTTSADDGSYEFAPQSPVQNTWYKVVDAHTSSTRLFEGVKALVQAEASATSAASGETVQFTGTVTPADAGQAVELQREDPGGVGFHVVDAAVVGPGGSYSLEHVLAGAGTQVFRVKAAGDSDIEPAVSGPLDIAVTSALSAALESQTPGA